MSQHQKNWLLFLSLLTVVAVIALVSGLSGLDLHREGEPLPRISGSEEEQMSTSPLSKQSVGTVLRVLFAVVGALLPFAIIYYLVAPEARKRLLRDVIALLVVLLPLYLLVRAQPEALNEIGLPQQLTGGAEDLSSVPEVAFTPQVGRWVVWTASVALALLLAGFLVGVGWAFWRRSQRSTRPLDQLGEQAQRAVDAIGAGADLKDTVTRCYFEMMQVLNEERGIRRQEAMTPREFEAQLEEVGMPLTQVRRLTRLFEQVRYGDKSLGRQEERQAVVALTSIVRLCRGGP